jgi:hypothetical protein
LHIQVSVCSTPPRRRATLPTPTTWQIEKERTDMKSILQATAAAAIALFGIQAASADTLTTGVINPDGSKQGNGPYTVSHPTAGRYIITLTNFTGTPVCVFNVIGLPTSVVGLGISTKTCDVTFVKKKKPTSVLFTFFAAPVS